MTPVPDFRTQALAALLERAGEDAERLLALHPAPPEIPESTTPRLRDLLFAELRREEWFVERTLDLPRSGEVLTQVSYFLRRRALDRIARPRRLARHVPAILARLALLDREALDRVLLEVGISVFACATLRIPGELRVAFLRPLGTDLARATTDRLAREAAFMMTRPRPHGALRILDDTVRTLGLDLTRGKLVRRVGATIVRARRDALTTAEATHLERDCGAELAAALAVEPRFGVPDRDAVALLDSFLDDPLGVRTSCPLES